MLVTVDMADWAVSNEPHASLITHSLGSCIGVSIYDPQARVGGLLHFMLPDSSVAPEQAADYPGMFADTGLVRLFLSSYDLGAVKQRLRVRVAGGSQLLGSNEDLNIGKRNYLAMLRILRRNGVRIEAEDVGGSVCRGLQLDVATGIVRVRTRDGEVCL